MKPSDAIIEKIQKLLALANSDNEHEAKNATRMANELLLKYNLDLQQISDHQNEYVVFDAEDTGLTLKSHQKMIAQILMNFFFVKVMIMKNHSGYSSGEYSSYKGPRAQYKKTFQLIGTKANCQIASYIFSFLNTAYPKAFQDYYDRNASVEKSHRDSYYKGLTIGIMEVLEATKFKIEEERGLVVKSDPKLDEFVKNRSSGSYGSHSHSRTNQEAYQKGIEDGAKMQLRKPIEAKQSQDNTKRLTKS